MPTPEQCAVGPADSLVNLLEHAALVGGALILAIWLTNVFLGDDEDANP